MLQDGEFYRIGGTKTVRPDIRILAATNRPLETMVKEGKFRSDLYWRLNVVPIHIPPLRERRADITPLVNLFLNKFNAKYSQNKKFSPEVYEILEQYRWPGNVRELQNLVERIVVTATTNYITPMDLPDHVNHSTGSERPDIIPLKEACQNVEKTLIQKALQKYGSTRQAAQALRVDHSTIVKKIKRYGLFSQSPPDPDSLLCGPEHDAVEQEP